MGFLRAVSDYGWRHEWAFLPSQSFVWGVWLIGLPYWVAQRDRTAAQMEARVGNRRLKAEATA